MDATDVRNEMILKPLVQSAIEQSRRLGHVLRDALTLLGPIFGSPKWDLTRPTDPTRVDQIVQHRSQISDFNPVDKDPLASSSPTPTTELSRSPSWLGGDPKVTANVFLGQIDPWETTGDLSVLSHADRKPRAVCSMYAGATGAVVLKLSRSAFLQAQASGPLNFLKKLPRFSSMPRRKLEDIAVHMRPMSLLRGSTLCHTGQANEYIWFVRTGMVELRVRVGGVLGLNKPVPWLIEQEQTERDECSVKLARVQGFTTLGAGDVIDIGQRADGKWIANCDVVASSSDVTLYSLKRNIVPNLANGTWDSVHRPAMYDAKVQTRQQGLSVLNDGAEASDLLMTPEAKIPEGQSDLGWQESGLKGSSYPRLPENIGKLVDIAPPHDSSLVTVPLPPQISTRPLPNLVRVPIRMKPPRPNAPITGGSTYGQRIKSRVAPRPRRPSSRGADMSIGGITLSDLDIDPAVWDGMAPTLHALDVQLDTVSSAGYQDAIECNTEHFYHLGGHDHVHQVQTAASSPNVASPLTSTRRRTSTGFSSTPQIEKVAEDWICALCTQLNFKEATRCRVCAREKGHIPGRNFHMILGGVKASALDCTPSVLHRAASMSENLDNDVPIGGMKTVIKGGGMKAKLAMTSKFSMGKNFAQVNSRGSMSAKLSRDLTGAGRPDPFGPGGFNLSRS